MRAHRRPRPYSGRSPKCQGSARRAQWPTFTAKSLLTTPFPKPHVPRSVGARAEGAWRVWEGLSSGWGTSDLYQTPQKAISVFFVPPPDLLLEDPVVGRPTPPWGPRRGRRDPDIHSVLVRGVFVRVRARSCILRVGIQEGWYPPNTEIHLPRTRVPGVLSESGWASGVAGASPIYANPLGRRFWHFRVVLAISPPSSPGTRVLGRCTSVLGGYHPS